MHQKDTVREQLDDDVFASGDLAAALPKYRRDDHECDPPHVRQLVVDELMLDGNSRQNLATFCQTWADPEIREIMALTIDKNMIGKDEYPQTAELEERCVHMLADLWNSPEAANILLSSTTGSSEAAMLGGMALQWTWRDRQRAARKPTDKPNLVTGPVQICWHKFARYWDVELREIPMEDDRLIMTPAEVVKRVDANTIGVVPTLRVTFTCRCEPVHAVSDALDTLQQQAGLTSRSTSTVRAAAPSLRSSIPISSGTSVCHGSRLGHLLLDDYTRGLTHLAKHPTTRLLDASDATGFNHN